MVVLPAGEFMMGSAEWEGERNDDEGPRHFVTIPRMFAVGRYEVTRSEYGQFVMESGRRRVSTPGQVPRRSWPARKKKCCGWKANCELVATDPDVRRDLRRRIDCPRTLWLAEYIIGASNLQAQPPASPLVRACCAAGARVSVQGRP